MILTEEQIKNNYPLNAVKFMNSFDKYLSNDVDEYELKKCNPDSFDVFAEIDKDLPKKLMKQYEQAVKAIHAYLDKGLQL